ncbi:MAG: hypothetical protein H7250_06075 [Flavobacterium sp.]|nr:hypothetical protein [Flavobacterium sp.]
MKKVILSILILSALSSCKKNETSDADNKTLIDSTETKNITKTAATLCFEFSKNKDTTDVSLIIEKNNQVSGKMHWNPFEKDGAIGVLNGIKKGDTIVADFDYIIEGNKQLEEKVFILKNNELQELIGALKDKKGKLIIKDLKKATVRNTLILKDCSKIKFPK